jgi:hypothetical protein
MKEVRKQYPETIKWSRALGLGFLDHQRALAWYILSPD